MRTLHPECLGTVNPRFLAIINPAAGGGRCGRLAAAALQRVRAAGIEVETVNTRQPGEATAFARRSAYESGTRKFLAVGGDGTSPAKSSTGFSHPRSPRANPRSDFCLWAPETPSCATSPREGWTTPSKPCLPAVPVPAM